MSIWKVLLWVVGLGIAGAATVAYLSFGAFLPWREDDEIDRLATMIGAVDGMTIAEIGAGTGRFSEGLAARVAPRGRVYASEISTARLADLRARTLRAPNLTVIEATASQTGLPDQCCDVILMRAMYHHVGDVPQFLSGCDRPSTWRSSDRGRFFTKHTVVSRWPSRGGLRQSSGPWRRSGRSDSRVSGGWVHACPRDAELEPTTLDDRVHETVTPRAHATVTACAGKRVRSPGRRSESAP